RPRERQRLARQLVVGALQEDERHATPSCWSTSTTRGAAAGPSTRISACLRAPSGTTRRSFSSLDAGRATARTSTGFDLARSFAGTDGYRGRFRPSFTVTTAGSETS